MKKLIKNIIGLRRYFTLSCWHKEVPKRELMTSNEALKAFGQIALNHKADIMMMMAVIEYEYGRNRNYSDNEIAAVKKTLAEIMKYFISCGQEWEEYENEQSRSTLKNRK
jgi:hypothetical protein